MRHSRHWRYFFGSSLSNDTWFRIFRIRCTSEVGVKALVQMALDSLAIEGRRLSCRPIINMLKSQATSYREIVVLKLWHISKEREREGQRQRQRQSYQRNGYVKHMKTQTDE